MCFKIENYGAWISSRQGRELLDLRCTPHSPRDNVLDVMGGRRRCSSLVHDEH
jgi:hypothetical protein